MINKEELKQLFDKLPDLSVVKLAPEQDWDMCRQVRMPDGTMSKIKDHAKIGVRALIHNPYFALFDEMGAMKSAQTIIAAQFLFLQGVIDRVIVVCPASVRPVWFDPELGELQAQLFEGLPARVSQFHSKIRQWNAGDWKSRPNQLRWIVTNYEFLGRSRNFIKRKRRQIPTGYLRTLLQFCHKSTLLVLDESSAIKSKKPLQSKACHELRKRCGRVVLLNGTPISQSPLDLMNQANTMHPSILEAPFLTTFRSRYCQMKPGVDFPQVQNWLNLDDLQKRMGPYVLRRLKIDCLDLPPKLPPVIIPAPLSESTWRRYKEMRDDLVVWMSDNEASLAPLAITKVMRLAQLCSGFIGGVGEVFPKDDPGQLPAFMQDEDLFEDLPPAEPSMPLEPTQSISTEKQDVLLQFLKQQLEEDPKFKMLVWCRFQMEVVRLVEALQKQFPGVATEILVGGQRRVDREVALRLLNPKTATDRPAVLCAVEGTGALGHNFTAASVAVNLSSGYSLFKYKQGSDRIHRPGQTKPCSYFDIIATGPKGQQTIEHKILKSRNEKDDLATITSNAWVQALTKE